MQKEKGRNSLEYLWSHTKLLANTSTNHIFVSKVPKAY
jgi:hypothetical protein